MSAEGNQIASFHFVSGFNPDTPIVQVEVQSPVAFRVKAKPVASPVPIVLQPDIANVAVVTSKAWRPNGTGEVNAFVINTALACLGVCPFAETA